MRTPRFPSPWKILAAAMFLLLLTSRSTWIVWLPSSPSSTGSQNIVTTNNISTAVNIIPTKGHGFPPVLAFWIFGSTGDTNRMSRLLKAIYHPRNQYLMELDAESSDGELADLAMWVDSQSVFGTFGNVNVVGKKSFGVNQMGASALAAMLHAAAVLMRLSPHWDWFVNLSPDDYPLVTPDDLLHALNSLPRDLNFVHYTNSTDWKEKDKKNQIVVDPSLHLQKGSYLYYAVEQRDAPDAFHIFGGSPRVILTRNFLEYCVQGWNNLPRKLLMYFTNTAYPLESYFHTVLCNSPDFQNATVLDSDLRYNIIVDGSDLQYKDMLGSGAVFVRGFRGGDRDDRLILDKVDDDVFKGRRSWLWCLSEGGGSSKGDDADMCSSSWGNSSSSSSSSSIIDVVKAGAYGVKLQLLLSKLVSQGRNTTMSYCSLPSSDAS
ncbi:unnamed protein product [Linum trigynum]|uniref:Uncharacterized protein n=1 Tax=Linum trigynum TaxID=586398 RepID=A0AAV2DK28_9ROSI